MKIFMKILIFFSLFSVLLFFSSCASVKSLNDYDSVSYEKKEHTDQEILGTVEVSTLGFIWTSLSPNDRKTIKLMTSLEEKALREYGHNIEIIDVSIGGMNALTTTFLWGLGGAAFTGAAVASSRYTEEVTDEYGNKENKVNNDTGYGTAMGIALGSLGVFLFKGIEAKAVVIKSEIPYKKGSYRLITEEELKTKQNKYYANRKEIESKRLNDEKNAKLKEEEELREKKLKENQELYNNLRNQLIIRGKDVKSPVVVLDYGISKINSADGVSCYVNFINISDKLAKYVNISLVPYNRVFDKAYSHLDGSSEKTVNVTNFIGPNESYSAAWENVWYNSTILTMKISKIEMIFADNTSLVIDNPEDLKKIEFSADEYTQYLDLKSSIDKTMR